MPSIDHEGPVQLLENSPDLAPRLLRSLGVSVPDYIEARICNIDFSQLVPAAYRADQAVTLWTGRKKPAMGIISEVQTGIDLRKKYTWPLYNAAMRAEYECDVCLLVITLNESVARWAREAITGLQPDCRFVPLVLGPEQVPWVRTEPEAHREPELAVLSAMAHGNAEGGLLVASAAVEAAVRLDDDRKRLYADLVFHSLNAENFQKLVNIMDMSKYEPQSEACKTWKTEGKAEGKAEDILAVLSTRGLVTTAEDERRIMSCRDADLLSRWLVRAVTAATIEEVFRDR